MHEKPARSLTLVGFVAVTLALWPSPLFPQAVMTMDGIVRTSDGMPLAGAEVSVADPETGERRSARTGEAGRFRIVGLEPGRYAASARFVGYTPATQAVQLVVGQNARVVLALEPEPVALETVQVVAQEQAAVEIERTSVSFPVLEEEIRNLPFSTRNVMELAAIVPGIRSFRSLHRPQSRSETGIPSAGAFPENGFINLYVDGLPMKSMYDASIVGMPQTGSPFPADAIREFRVLLNPYDAEYSHAGVYIISAVTHRGTNETRGSAFGFFQNAGMVSATDFQRALPGFHKPDYSRQKGGFNLRGPIVRDRLFYAMSYELSNTANFIHVTPGRPAANPGFWDEYAGAYRAPNRNHTGLSRLTFAPTAAHTMDAIWSARYLTGMTFFGGTVAHESAVAQDYGVHTLNLRHRWTPSARLANELSLQLVNWSHDDDARSPEPLLVYPSLQIGTQSSHQHIRERHVRLVNRTTFGIGDWHGSHLLKVGVEAGRVSSRGRFPALNQGRFEFAADTSTMPLLGIIGVGVFDPFSDSDGAGWIGGWVLGAYLNDEWRPHQNLTLNFGLRYDVEPNTLNNKFAAPWADDPELASIPQLQRYLNRGGRKDDRDNLSPRASFAWDVFADGRTFLRGGFGIIYDRVPRVAAFRERLFSTWRVYGFLNPGTRDPDMLRQRVIAGDGAAQLAPVLLPEKLETAFTRQLSIGVGRQITSELGLNLDFVHQDVRDLFAQLDVNWLDSSVAPPRRALSQRHRSIVVWDSFARARYRALLAQLSYHGPSRLRANVAYTLGYARADWDGWPAEAPAAFRDDFYVLQRTSGDERHRFVLSGTGALPWGLTASTIVTVASPRPYNAFVGQDLNRNGFLEDDWIGDARYLTPDNAWRNWYRMVDLRLARAVPVGGRARMSLIAEAFNLLNTENYASFSGRQRDRFGNDLASFGTPSGIFATRQFQLGARLDF